MNSFEFEIAIQRKFGKYWPVVVRVKQPDGLTTHTEGTLQLGEDDLIQLKQEQENYLEYGTRLGKALFRDQVRETFVRTLGQSSQECPLRVLLSNEADGKDEVRSLHWERLCAPIDAGGGWNLLARDQRVPFSLYIPTIIDRRFPPIGRRDLRALVVVASPTNLDKYNLAPFNVEQAVNGVRAALGDVPCDVLANIDGAIGEPTLEQLSAQLTEAKQPYTLLHFVCHGMLGKDGETALFWATKDDRVQRVTGAQLRSELKYIGNKQGLPQLTFLCTCESAAPRAEGALGGLAQRLVRDLGMPVVVAMTRKISVETALKLGQKFYQRLREHGEVDLALEEATAGLGHRDDITVPAIFSRLGGRPLFTDRLDDRELTDAEIEFGLEEFRKLLLKRAPNAKVLKESFEQQVQILKQTQGSQLPAARQQHQQAIDELNLLSSQVLEISFEALAALDKKPPEYDAECPFPGLSSFRKQKYHKFFFGRELLVAELQQALSKDNFLAVLGPSGSGKSSVVLAGLIPQLQKQQTNLHMAYLTPSSEPVAELQESLSKLPKQPVLLVVDQFEELFTLCSDERQRREFIAQLLQLAQTQKVVITMRADFLGECTFYEQLSQRMEQNPKFIGPMDAAQLGKAMKMQADRAYLEFEQGLNNAILAEVEQEPGAMPLLQYALRSLWNRRRGRWLCYEEYEAIGGVQKAISQTADAVYESLSAVEQEQVKNIFIRLTRLAQQTFGRDRPQDTRRRVGLEELVLRGDDPTVTKRLLERLAGEGARLVVTSRNEVTGVEEVEVTHEALISHWERLQEWLEENRSNLQLRENITEAAREWEGHEKEESYLVHRGGRLEDAEVLLKQPQFLNRREEDYVTACVELRDRLEKAKEARRRREIRTAWGIASGALFFLFVTTGLGLMAWNQKRAAQIGQIKALTELSKASLLTNEQLTALIASVKAAKKLKRVRGTDKKLKETVEIALRDAVYNIQERNYLEGHSDKIYSVSFSPDNKIIASASQDGTVKVWGEEGKLLETLKHKKPVRRISFSPDGKLIASASEDRTVQLWKLDGSLEKTLQHSVPILAVTFSPKNCPEKLIASSGTDGIVRLWSWEGKLQRTFSTSNIQTDEKQVNDLRFSPDCQKIASASADKTIKLWDLKGNLLTTLQGHEDKVWQIDFSADGKTIVSASSDTTLRLWTQDEQGKFRPQQKILEGHTNWVRSVSFSPNNNKIVSASDDHTVKIWDRYGTFLYTFITADAASSISFSSDGKLIAVASNQKIRLWQFGGMAIKTLRGHSSGIKGVRFSPHGETIASVSTDETLRLWERNPSTNLFELKKTLKYEAGLRNVNFTPHDENILTASYDHTMQLWNIKDALASEKAVPQRIFSGHNSTVKNLSISPDGKTLASASGDGTVRLWGLERTPAGKSLKHDSGVNDVSFSPNGKKIVSVDAEGWLRLWTINGDLLQKFQGHDDGINALMFSPDGKFIATASRDKTIKLWQENEKGEFDEQAYQTLDKSAGGHEDGVWDVAFSFGGKMIASAGKDDKVKLWKQGSNNSKFELITTLQAHKDWVRAVSFSPNGKKLASASADKTIIVWNIKKINEIEAGEEQPVLDSLLKQGCDWLSNYLKTNQNLDQSDRSLCTPF